MIERRFVTPGLYVLFFLSGAAALGYQLVWSKMFSTGLGHEMPAVLAIVCAIMVGMALGSFAIDRFVPRDFRAGRWLAALEFTIGLWAVLASLWIPRVNEFALRIIGLEPGAIKHWLVAFLIPTIFLLPATSAMGATFPVMEKFLSAVVARRASIGSVYAANTFGAVAGTLLTPFVLMPKYGFRDSCWALAVLNFIAGLGVMILSVRLASERRSPHEPLRTDSTLPAAVSSPRITVTLFLTGLLSIGFEVTGVRVLTQVLEGTVFTYATVLAVFLLGMALGAAMYHRWWNRVRSEVLLGRLYCGLAVATLCGVFVLSCAKLIYRWLRTFGDTPFQVFTAEFLTAAAVFVPATILMGAMFSHLVQLARARRGSVGGVIAMNTLGAGVAPLLCAVMLVPTIGTKFTLMLVAIGYLALGIGLPQFKLALIALPFLWLAYSADLRIVDRPSDSRIVDYREGVMASVAVVEEQGGSRILRVDNRYQMGGTAAADAQYRQAHLPLLLHPASRRALFLGVGTGISFGMASLYPGLKADGVELVPEVIDVLPLFQPANLNPALQPDLHLHVADARRYVRSSGELYDVIIADVFHPYRDGAGALYTHEHFAAIRARLNTNGLFCQWLPLHQLDAGNLRVIARTFLSVFPDAQAWLLRFNVDVPVIGLVGGNGDARFSSNWVEARIQGTAAAEAARRLSISDSVRFFGHFLVGPHELSDFADRSNINTDDNQIITFAAPRTSYEQGEKPYASLLRLMEAKDLATPRLSALSGDADLTARVTKYSQARDAYFRGLIADAENRRDEAVDAYIESARLSPEFTSGYAQCLSIANVMAGTNPSFTRKILERLVEAQPERPVAKEMLKRLFGP
jgi:spermidine synthase